MIRRNRTGASGYHKGGGIHDNAAIDIDRSHFVFWPPDTANKKAQADPNELNKWKACSGRREAGGGRGVACGRGSARPPGCWNKYR